MVIEELLCTLNCSKTPSNRTTALPPGRSAVVLCSLYPIALAKTFISDVVRPGFCHFAENNGWPPSLLTHQMLLEWKAARASAKDKDKVGEITLG